MVPEAAWNATCKNRNGLQVRAVWVGGVESGCKLRMAHLREGRERAPARGRIAKHVLAGLCVLALSCSWLRASLPDLAQHVTLAVLGGQHRQRQ